MKELLRLRHFASRAGPVLVCALIAIVLTSGLQGLAIWQTNNVLRVAFRNTAVGDAGDDASGDSTAGLGQAKRKLHRVFPGVMELAERVGEPLNEWWRGVFHIDSAPSEVARLRRSLLAACVALMILGVSASFADMVGIYLVQYIGHKILYGVRQSLFEHLQSLSLTFFENQRSGDLISRLSNDTTLMQALFTSPVAALLGAPPTCLAMLVIMLVLNWRLSIAILVLLPIVSGLAAWLGSKLKRYSRRVQARMADLVAFVEQTLSGMRVVQAFGMERHVAELFEKANQLTFRAAMRQARVRSANAPVAGLLLTVGIVTALLVGGNEIIAGRMEASDLVTFVLAMQLLGSNVSRFTRLNLTVQQGAGACGRIWEIMDVAPDLTDAPDAIDMTDTEGRVTFRDVSFAYDKDLSPVLSDVDLDISAGEVLAVAGPSGAGKSTLANLVPRLYDVTSGQVLVDSVDVRKLKRASLRRLVGIVPQETLLFGTTVKENIAYGRPEASEDEIVAAAKAAQAHGFISALAEGYDTQIGERGVKLSGGQRQRVAIARALLRNPRILILDEATSSLDAESESAVHTAINRLLDGRTALIIAHRLSTIRDADRILVLDRGRIVEEGTHEQLMRSGGLYRALYETQLREEKASVAPELTPET